MAEIAERDHVFRCIWTDRVRNDVMGVENTVGSALAVAADLALQVVASLYEFCQALPVQRVVIGNTLPPSCALRALL